jgi:chromosome segregation ATPase
MSDTDFFDDDLVKVNESRGVPSDAPAPIDKREAEVKMRRLNRERNKVEDQLANAEGEIERLRHKRDEQARVKEELESIREKQKVYETSKKTMLERLNKYLIGLEQEEVRTSRLTSLYGDTRKRFAGLLVEIEEIDETSWPEAEFHDELGTAQVLLDSVRVECSKSLAKIEAIQRDEDGLQIEGNPLGQPATAAQERPGFAYWLKVGLAISLPLVLALVGAGVLVYWLISLLK